MGVERYMCFEQEFGFLKAVKVWSSALAWRICFFFGCLSISVCEKYKAFWQEYRACGKSVNPKSTSNQSSKPCTVLQYPSRKEYRVCGKNIQRVAQIILNVSIRFSKAVKVG